MDSRLALRAGALQLVLIALLFALLVALPLSRDLFRDWGALIGPASWLACALASGRTVGIGYANAIAVAAGSGLAGGLVGLVAGHAAGMVVAVLAFAVLAGLRGRERPAARTVPIGAS